VTSKGQLQAPTGGDTGPAWRKLQRCHVPAEQCLHPPPQQRKDSSAQQRPAALGTAPPTPVTGKHRPLPARTDSMCGYFCSFTTRMLFSLMFRYWSTLCSVPVIAKSFFSSTVTWKSQQQQGRGSQALQKRHCGMRQAAAYSMLGHHTVSTTPSSCQVQHPAPIGTHLLAHKRLEVAVEQHGGARRPSRPTAVAAVLLSRPACRLLPCDAALGWTASLYVYPSKKACRDAQQACRQDQQSVEAREVLAGC